MKKALTITTLGLLILISCSKDGVDGDDDNGGGGGGGSTLNCSTVTNKAFNADVLPIFNSTCAINSGCHATGSPNGPGALTNYTQIFAARTAIRNAVSTGQMPQGSTLPAAQKNSILCWIDSGAPNN